MDLRPRTVQTDDHVGQNTRNARIRQISGQIGSKVRTEKEYSPEIYHSVTPVARSSASGRKAAISCFRLRLWPPNVALPAYAYQRGVSCVLANFTGVDAPYEEPLAPEIRLPTVEASAEALAERVVDELRARGIIAV